MATDLTTSASVRAVLGISEKELRDDVLRDPIYTVRLTEAIYAMSATMYDDFVLAVAIAESSRTRLQQRFVDLMQTYSAYQIAAQCLGSVAMFAPQLIKDSRSELQRFADPFKALRIDVPASLLSLQGLLLGVYAQINPSAPAPAKVTRVLVTAAPLGTDPVTGV